MVDQSRLVAKAAARAEGSSGATDTPRADGASDAERSLEAETSPMPSDALAVTGLVRERLGIAPSRIVPVAAGLGLRRFYRVELDRGDPDRLIARVEDPPAPTPETIPETGPDWLPEPRLEPLRRFLEEAGLPVPRSYGHDVDRGIDLLEDVGARTLADAKPSERLGLYAEAAGLLPRLQRLTAPAERIEAFGRRYGEPLIRTKAWKTVHWLWPGLLERPAGPAEREAIEKGFAALADLLGEAPRRLAHRDFKAANLHLVEGPGGEGPQVVMIDLQGAFVAPPEYDLVCLLQDAQVRLEDALVAEVLAQVRPRLPDAPDAETFELRFHAIATMRLCKDLSHFVHAARERGDPRYRRDVPRGLELLERSAERLASLLPGARALAAVIQTLTRTRGSADTELGGGSP